jgi:hypothetical protein
MTKRVLRLVWNQYLDSVRLPMMLEGIDEQIRRETGATDKLRPVAKVFLVPDAFKKPYRAVFPELYQRIYLGLEDKSRIHDALTEVTYDFLTRWGPSFEEFGEHHRSFLYELCDRTLAKENGDVRPARDERALPAPPTDGNGSFGEGQAGVRLKRLADEVLRVVEQDLRSFQPQLSA